MPLVELVEQIRIDLEEVERGRIRQSRRFHEAEKQKQIVELGRLLSQIVFVAAERHAVHELAQALAEFGEFIDPIHA